MSEENIKELFKEFFDYCSDSESLWWYESKFEEWLDIKLKEPEMLKTKKKIKNNQNIEKRNKLFIKLWTEREHKCQSCNTYLGKEIYTYYFDHLLEKGKSRYKHLEFEEDNIAIVCLDCHAKKTNGFPTKKHQELIDKAKIKFNIQ